MMTEDKKLYVPWSEKREEVKEALGLDDEQTQDDAQLLRAQAWDRTEDQVFIFIMTIALM